MTLDIQAALEASPTRGARRCPTAEFVYGIPEDTPGRDELIRLFESEYEPKSELPTRSGQNMAMVLTNLGFEVTQNPIHDHRKRACRCYR